MQRVTLLGLVAVVALMGCSASDRPTEPALRVFAAASLKPVLADLAVELRGQHPATVLDVIFGASGTLAGQIINGAAADVFLSADLATLKRIVEHGRAIDGNVFVYAVGRLVVWVPAHSPVASAADGVSALSAASVRRIAIPNPRHAPYGRAAEAALASFKLKDVLAGQIVYGENAEQAAHFAASGAADAAIIPRSLAGQPALASGRTWLIPADAHPPVQHAGVILSTARDRAAAERLRDTICSPAGQALLNRHGFEPLP